MSSDPTVERAERIAALLEDDAIPTDDGDGPVFEAPWQARMFAVALAFHEENDDYDFSAFQERLVEAISNTDPQAMQEDVEGVYYERWMDVLESVLVDAGVLSPEEIDERKAEFTAGERDASEFVRGDHDH